jgi:putative hydrolase of the HAD superfamily
MEPHIVTPLQGRTIRVLLFDLGETLWTYIQPPHWEKLELEANQRISSILREQLALTSQTDTELLALSQQFRMALRPHIRAHMRKDAEREPDFIQVVQETFAEFGWPAIAPARAFTLFQHTQIPVDGSRLLFTDVIATLTAFQQRGFLLGVVTNRIWGGTPFLASMDKLGLLKFFAPEAIAISADLRIRKPHAAIFQYALQALHVEAEEALMVGDSLHADITGSNRLHMYSVWKPGPRTIAAFAETLEQPQEQLHATRLLSYQRDQEQKKYREWYEEPQPDLIIQHLRDLLTLLPKAGRQ